MIRGYGRGWSEEKAIGFLPRLRQKAREPATKHDYIIAMATVMILAFAAISFLPWTA